MNVPAYERLTETEPVSEVRFVQDYVQFVLGPHTLSVYPKLRVSIGKRVLSPADSGFYDCVCTLIGQNLVAATRIEKVQLEFLFSRGTKLLVSLRPEDAVGPEIGVLSETTGADLIVERYDD